MPQDPLAGRVEGRRPMAERIIDGQTYTVQLDLTPIMGSILKDLGRALFRAKKLWLLRGLGMARPGSPEEADFQRELLGLAGVHDAFLVQLTASDADELDAELYDAKDEPPRCGNSGCDNYATTLDGIWCPSHDPEGWDGVTP